MKNDSSKKVLLIIPSRIMVRGIEGVFSDLGEFRVEGILSDISRTSETRLKNMDEMTGKDIFQLTPFINEAEEQMIRPAIPNCEIGRWHPAFADITAIGNTKQRGIDEMIRRFGIRREETMAFGDGGNDISMLRHVGIGVAMGNAAPDVRSHADYVTSTVDEDGIVNAVRHFGLL